MSDTDTGLISRLVGFARSLLNRSTDDAPSYDPPEPRQPTHRGQYDCPECGSSNSKLVIRAREHVREWGSTQVLECRECEKRWSV